MNAILPHTGMPWFDAVVCVVSGVAFIRLCWLFPRHIKNQYELAKALVESKFS